MIAPIPDDNPPPAGYKPILPADAQPGIKFPGQVEDFDFEASFFKNPKSMFGGGALEAKMADFGF